MSDSEPLTFEKTKFTILDNIVFIRNTRWFVIPTAIIGVIISFLAWTILVPPRDLTALNNINNYLSFTQSLTLLIWGLAISILIINIPLFYILIFKGRRQEKELLLIQSGLRRRSYLMNFELVEPEIKINEGDTRLEKIMNHLSFVFPEVQRINEKRIKKKNSAEKYASKFKRKAHFLKNYDLGIKTVTGFFIIQFYKNMTLNDIEKIAKKFSHEKKYLDVAIQRVILVGNDFDFSVDKQPLLEMMDSLKRNIHLDIIKEGEYGYSTIWID